MNAKELTAGQAAVLSALHTLSAAELAVHLAKLHADIESGQSPRSTVTQRDVRRKLATVMVNGTLRMPHDVLCTLLDLLLEAYGSSPNRGRQLSVEVPGGLKPLVTLGRRPQEHLARRAIALLEVSGRANRSKFGVTMRLEGGVDMLCAVVVGSTGGASVMIDTDLLTAALSCLSLCCETSEATGKLAAKRGVVPPCVSALRRYLTLTSVVEPALSLLAAIVEATTTGVPGSRSGAPPGGPACLLECDEDAPDLIVRCLRAHGDVPTTAVACLRLMHAMAADSHVAAQLAQDGAFHATWWVAGRHPDRPGLLSQALATLWRLSASAARATALGAPGGGGPHGTTPWAGAAEGGDSRPSSVAPPSTGLGVLPSGWARDGVPKSSLGVLVGLTETVLPGVVERVSGEGNVAHSALLAPAVWSTSAFVELGDGGEACPPPTPRLPYGAPPSTVTIYALPREYIGVPAVGLRDVQAALPRWAGYTLPRPGWYPALPGMQGGVPATLPWPPPTLLQAAADLTDVKRRIAVRMGKGAASPRMGPSAPPMPSIGGEVVVGCAPTIQIPVQSAGEGGSAPPGPPSPASLPQTGQGSPRDGGKAAKGTHPAGSSSPLEGASRRLTGGALGGGVSPALSIKPTQLHTAPSILAGAARPEQLMGFALIGKHAWAATSPLAQRSGGGAEVGVEGERASPPTPSSPPAGGSPSPTAGGSGRNRLTTALSHSRSARSLLDEHSRLDPVLGTAGRGGGGEGVEREAQLSAQRPSTAPASPIPKPWHRTVVSSLKAGGGVSSGRGQPVGAAGGARAGAPSVGSSGGGVGAGAGGVGPALSSGGGGTTPREALASAGPQQAPTPGSLWEHMRCWMAAPHWFPELQLSAILLPEIAHHMEGLGAGGSGEVQAVTGLLADVTVPAVQELCASALTQASAGQWAHLSALVKRVPPTPSLTGSVSMKQGTTGFLPATAVTPIHGPEAGSQAAATAERVQRASLAYMRALTAVGCPYPWRSEEGGPDPLTRPYPTTLDAPAHQAWVGEEGEGGVSTRGWSPSSPSHVTRVWVTPSGMASIRPFLVPPQALPTAFHAAAPMASLARAEQLGGASGGTRSPGCASWAARVAGLVPPAGGALGAGHTPSTTAPGSPVKAAGAVGSTLAGLSTPPSLHHPLASGYVLVPATAGSKAGGMLVDLLEPLLVVSATHRNDTAARLQLKSIARLGLASGLLLCTPHGGAAHGSPTTHTREAAAQSRGPDGRASGEVGQDAAAATFAVRPVSVPVAYYRHAESHEGVPTLAPRQDSSEALRVLHMPFSRREVESGPLPVPDAYVGTAVPLVKAGAQGAVAGLRALPLGCTPGLQGFTPDMAQLYGGMHVEQLLSVLPGSGVGACCPRPLTGGEESGEEDVGGAHDDDSNGSDEDAPTMTVSHEKAARDAARDLEEGLTRPFPASPTSAHVDAEREGMTSAVRHHARSMRGVVSTAGISRREAIRLLSEAEDEVYAMAVMLERERRGGAGDGSRARRRRRQAGGAPLQEAVQREGVSPHTTEGSTLSPAPLPLLDPPPRLPTQSRRARLLSRVPPLHFESRFECGNLCSATRVAPMEYELSLDPDTNTAGHTQWFFFRVRNMVGADGAHVQLIHRGGGAGLTGDVRRLFDASLPVEVTGAAHEVVAPLSSGDTSMTTPKKGAGVVSTSPSSPPSSSPGTLSSTSPDSAPAAVYRFHIVNLEKGGSSFNDGMRPLVYFQGTHGAAGEQGGLPVNLLPRRAGQRDVGLVGTEGASDTGGAGRSTESSRAASPGPLTARAGLPPEEAWGGAQVAHPDQDDDGDGGGWWTEEDEDDGSTAWHTGWPLSAQAAYGFGSPSTPLYVPAAASPESCHVPSLTGDGWRRTGVGVTYYRNAYVRSKPKVTPPVLDNDGCDATVGYVVNKSVSTPGVGEEVVKPSPQYSQSWSVAFPPGVHTAFFAYCLPFSYTDLRKDVGRYEERAGRVGAGASVRIKEVGAGGGAGAALRGEALHADTELAPTPALALLGQPFAGRVASPLSAPLGSLFHSPILHRTTLCHTVTGNPVPLLTITSFSDGPAALAARPIIVLSARVHPGESNGSWMMRGVLDVLTSSCPLAAELRARCIFKVVPMLNPDGVINGHHRTNAAGLDLNRHWSTPALGKAPTIWHLRALIMALQTRAAAAAALLSDRGAGGVPLDAVVPGVQGGGGDGTPPSALPYVKALSAASAGGQYVDRVVLAPTPQPVLLFCDFHGHSRRRDVFMFGCSELAQEGVAPVPGEMPAKGGAATSVEAGGEGEDAPTDGKAPLPAPHLGLGVSTRLFPRLLSSRIDTFSMRGCAFKVSKDKASAARVAVWRDALLNASYTIEASFGGPTDGVRKGTHFSSRTYEEVGYAFCAALLDLIQGPAGVRASTTVAGLLRKRAGVKGGAGGLAALPQHGVPLSSMGGGGPAVKASVGGAARRGAGGGRAVEVIIFGGGRAPDPSSGAVAGDT